MESLLAFMVALIRLVSAIAVIILFFLFIVRPLLNYFIVNREIEQHRKLNEDVLADHSPVDNVYRQAEVEDGPGTEEDISQGRGKKLSDREALSRLSASDPDKASDLIKKWVHDDSTR